MPNSLDGKVCMVTGAGSGIGRAAAVAMAAEGASVVVADVRMDELEKTAALVGRDGGIARVRLANVKSEEDVAVLGEERGVVGLVGAGGEREGEREGQGGEQRRPFYVGGGVLLHGRGSHGEHLDYTPAAALKLGEIPRRAASAERHSATRSSQCSSPSSGK